MKFNGYVLALLASAAPAAYSQSSVTLFGVVDVNFARMSGEGSGSRTLLGSDGQQSSRLGFRGVEDLGGGLKAGFWLEAGLSPDSGLGSATNANNQAAGAALGNGLQGLTFSRRSTVSLSGSWGEARFGRDYVPSFGNLSVFSPFGTNGVGSSGFLFYPVPGAARVTNVRASNSIGYFLPAMGGFYGHAMYAMGENPSNAGATADDGRVVGARVGYAAGNLDVALGTTKTTINALGDLKVTNVGASYDFGVVKAMALWNSNETGANETRTWLLGGLVPMGAGQFRVAFSSVKASGVANDASQIAVGYVHNLSKRTSLYTNYARVSNKNGGRAFHVGLAPTTAGGDANGFELGLRHSF